MTYTDSLDPEPESGSPKLHPGALISRKYRLLRLLGSGGMGSVWAARNELTDRDFAIKFLLPSLAQSTEALQRFFHEARACGQIKHPAVVDVYDMGQAEDGSPYLVMELLEGEGFDQRLARSGTFRPGEGAAWVAFLARGLEEAHVRGLVHRDLKPGNIFFALDDRGDVIPKVLDFGISKAINPGADDLVKTSTGAVLGSPAYMSPEQAKGEPDVDGRADVWSLGVILFEALTGELPFDAPNYNALMMAIITRPHRPASDLSPGVPREISAIIDRCLTKDRAQRIGTARELAELLEAAAAARQSGSFLGLGGPKIPTLVPGPSPYLLPSIPPPPGMPNLTSQGPWSEGRSTRPARRRSSSTWAGLAMLLVAVSLGGALAFLRLRPPLVALAGRSSAALMTSLARAHQAFAQLKVEATATAATEERAKEETAKSMVLQPSELPPVVTRRSGSGPASTVTASARKPKGKSLDPHGGVDSAGF